MNYEELKKSIIEIINNENIIKNNLIIQYGISANDFSKIYKSFVDEFGGEFKNNVDFFEIEIDDNLIFKCVKK